ncbi:kinase-like protein [Gigaspora margarita]|uniref:Kinase-like protein n=1 Tax=Gigaspora margarita TaxID=4874 RepID=A0A8H4ARH0_GIGMA|nr:kinase-like protein [Gigaspora margarita]
MSNDNENIRPNDRSNVNENITFNENNNETFDLTEYLNQVSPAVDNVTDIIIQSTESLTFANFIPVVKDIFGIVNEILGLFQVAKQNKRICGVLVDRVQAAKAAIENLIIRKDHYEDFFIPQNLGIMLNLFQSMKNIRDFVNKIHNFNDMQKFLQAQLIKNKFEELTTEFDGYISTLNFVITIDTNLKKDRDYDSLKEDIKETKEFLRLLVKSIDFARIPRASRSINVSDEDAMIGMMIDNRSEIIQLKNSLDDPRTPQKDEQDVLLSLKDFDSTLNDNENDILDYEDFETLEENHGNYYKRILKITSQEVIFKEIDLSRHINIQVKILKSISSSRDIIQYFGLIRSKENKEKKYIVLEWAEHGSLREFYQSKKLDYQLKSRIALDIARGLIFLDAHDILHHDIRSDNIMVDRHERAKIANFDMSRGYSDKSRKLRATRDNAPYMAPEKLENREYVYDPKCEIYSFGVLLWEIAEQKAPYLEISDVIELTKKILNREIKLKFSCQDIPEKWKQLFSEATDKNRKIRPEIRIIFEKITNFKSLNKTTKSSQPSLQTLMQNIFSLEDAIKHTNSKQGDKTKAWNSFCIYSNLNVHIAKYYKGYYLYHKLPPVNHADNERFKIAADLFKKAADNADITMAQHMYATCLVNGHGIEKNLELALNYFLKAANKDNYISMFRLGFMYYKGLGTKKNDEEGIYWLRLAAQHNVANAIKFCKEHNIDFEPFNC